jgi:hypothetical protein
MKAEVVNIENKGYVVVIEHGSEYANTFYGRNVFKDDADCEANEFNSALASHVESELTSKIEKIKAEFSDECINEKLRTPDVKSGMIEMRDEILNRLR